MAFIEHLRVRSSESGTDPDANCFLVLKAEIDTCMRLLGVEKVSELGPKHVSLSLPVHLF